MRDGAGYSRQRARHRQRVGQTVIKMRRDKSEVQSSVGVRDSSRGRRGRSSAIAGLGACLST